jgi:hypothetical protein
MINIIMRYKEITKESAVNELKDKLPSLAKHDYNTIDKLMKKISKKHEMSANALHDIFVKKYKKTPDDWIKNKLDEKELTTEDIKKTILKRTGVNNDSRKISLVYEDLSFKHYGRKVINPTTDWVNNLLPHIYENVDPEIKEFYTELRNRSKKSHVPVKIGAKLCLLQAKLDIYSHTVILLGFKNPKTIVDIQYDDDKIKQIEFDDGSVFPEKYEYSTTELGFDLLDTFFFKSRNDLEKMLTVISLIKPESYDLGTKLLTENMNMGIHGEVDKFCDWVCKKLNISNKPKIELSMDTQEAQSNTHTGGHMPGSGEVWVYAKNRNLVDILRTVAHELTHVKQHELGMIKPGDSYPGSPIELLADMVAGKLIKVYGKKHPKIFQ